MGRRNILTAFLIVFGLSIGIYAQSDYQNEINLWREKQATDLKSENGWLSLTGLFWLKEGTNTIGSDPGKDIKLPENVAKSIGTIEFKQGAANLLINKGVNILADGQPVTNSVEIISDERGKPTSIQIGEVNFTLIKREERYGIRVRDVNSPNRTKFSGLHWFPVDQSYLVTAQFEPYQTPKDVEIPNVLGGTYKMKSPGLIKFKLQGKDYSLEPVEEGDQLFIIFGDLSSRTSTYQSGRFLYAAKAENGKVILDFNKAHNPPCAYTEFATCPLPPVQNRLKTEVLAGEKRYDH